MRAMHVLRGLVDTRWQDVSDPHLLRPDPSGLAPSVDIDRPVGPGGAPTAALPDDEAAFGCAGCARVSRYGNCGDPVAAGLSDAFRLIAHPTRGLGCPARLPVNESGEGVAYWRVHAAAGRVDLAVCPPLSIEALRERYPGAARIEPIVPDEAWRS